MKIARTMTQEIESFEHVTIELLFSKLFSNNVEKRGGYLYSITAMNESWIRVEIFRESETRWAKSGEIKFPIRVIFFPLTVLAIFSKITKTDVIQDNAAGRGFRNTNSQGWIPLLRTELHDPFARWKRIHFCEICIIIARYHDSSKPSTRNTGAEVLFKWNFIVFPVIPAATSYPLNV